MDRLQYISSDRTPLIGSNILCFLGELMNIGLLGGVNYVECLYDLEGGAE
jgi:nuclear cap-binding protein subunit 1